MDAFKFLDSCINGYVCKSISDDPVLARHYFSNKCECLTPYGKTQYNGYKLYEDSTYFKGPETGTPMMKFLLANDDEKVAFQIRLDQRAGISHVIVIPYHKVDFEKMQCVTREDWHSPWDKGMGGSSNDAANSKEMPGVTYDHAMGCSRCQKPIV